MLKSWALPESKKSLPGSFLSVRTFSATSPVSSCEPEQSQRSNVEATTYLGMLFILSANPAPSVIDGQAGAKPS
jgi:hypothetical protein